ncbi:MAG TPA: hypothetical protein VFK12_04455, partial [Gammaproteobacteria bacterium]|nr:hypothetical protein [Gammaproteobacteria bacterium]
SVTASNIGSCCGAIHLAKVTGAGITITLNESGSNASNISVGSLTALGPSYIAVYMNNGSASGTGKLIVNGSIKANNGGGVELTNIGGNSIDVTGGISAAGIVAVTQNNNVANTINIGGNIKGSHLQMTAYGSGSINIHVGNVVAGSNVTITGDNYGSGSANITVGNVSGTEVIIAANAASNQNAVIHTGALNAMNAVARGLVSVSASGKNTTITTGAISAQGVLTPFAGGDPSTENPFFRDAANVTLATTGTGNNAITVNGGITLKGAGGHFHYSGSYGNIYTASGSTGQAVLAIKNLNTGNTTVKVAGAINATGVGYAGVDISASKVTLGGAVNLTATAGKMKQSGTLSYSSPQNIVYSESGTKLGRAELLIHDDSGASLGGAVTIKGPSAQLIVEGDGGITTRGISLTASGEKFQHKATGIDSYSHTVNYSSTESAGTAAVLLLAGSGNIAKDVKVQGNITVTGIGKAVVGIEGNTITTQSLTVTQAAGKYSRTGKLPSGVFSSSGGGPNQLVLSSNDQSFGGMSDRDDLFGFKQGTLNGGIGGVRLQGVSSSSYCSCETPATSITVGGSITVSAVGQGDVTIAGKTVNITGGITGTATRATANGSGMHSSNSGAFNYSIKHTANGSGGRMLVDIRGSQASGQSSSSHYNGDNNYTGTATIGGAISLTGPTASVQIKSGTIKTGNISVDGTGENISVTDVYTPSEGNAFTLKRSGVIDWTGIELSGKAGTGKVTTGNLLAEGPLFVAIHISAGTVTVGNLGVIASSGNVTLLDTRISTTPLTFTAGDAGVAISTISSAGSTSVFGAATVNGNINVEATRDAHLLTNAAVSGYVLVTAGGNIDDPLPANLLRFINHDPHSTGDSSSNAPTLNLSASALALLAGGNITLNDAVLKVGTGSVPGVVGDSTGIALLATQGLVSPGTPPNATFVAGGKLGLGKFTLTGDYLYMEASSYNLTGPISVPASTVVQFAPVSLPGSIGVEPGTSTSSQLNLSGTLLNLFPGTTFLIGGTGTTGDMTIGSQGKITLGGGSNFLVETAGNVTGLENILTTGLVGNLFELVNFQVPTASEIQNTSGTSDGNSDQKKKKTTNTGDNESGGGGGSVEQDDDTSGVCRG